MNQWYTLDMRVQCFNTISLKLVKLLPPAKPIKVSPSSNLISRQCEWLSVSSGCILPSSSPYSSLNMIFFRPSKNRLSELTATSLIGFTPRIRSLCTLDEGESGPETELLIYHQMSLMVLSTLYLNSVSLGLAVPRQYFEQSAPSFGHRCLISLS